MSPPVLRVLIATTNRGKLAELRPVMQEHGVAVLSLDDVPAMPAAPETGDSFAEIARAKAEYYVERTGLPSLADDSGLMVQALGGAPGIRSARWAGEGATDAGNLARLLAEMDGRAERRAEFVCALCLAAPGSAPLMVTGRCRGTIALAERGAGGFGYDSLFVPEEPTAAGRTFAELEPVAKALMSHRGEALSRLGRAIGPWLDALSAARDDARGAARRGPRSGAP